MNNFKHRIIEIHSSYAWDFNMVKRAIDFAKANGMTAICLHRNDFVDQVIYPAKYAGGNKEGGYDYASEIYNDVYEKMYHYDPLRRDTPCRNGVYFRKVLNEAKKNGLEVYIENKEINFPDFIELIHPSIRKNGALCPCEPVLLEFIEEKYRELFRLYPDIAGIITSLSTSESKVSFAINHCTCDICKNKETADWYNDVIMAMYRPIKEANAQLIIRDFVFDSKSQEGIFSNLENTPEDIIFSLKNTPHDYYPTFPNNRRLEQIPDHQKWIEYDVFGQYYGLGIGVAVMVEDIRQRLQYAKENGANGVLVRTCWEGLSGTSVFDTPNMISLFAIAALSKDMTANEDSFYDKWLTYRSFYSDGISQEQKLETIKEVKGVFGKTWDVLKRTAFMNDCVFSDSTMFPCGMEHAFWLAEEKNSLRDWDSTKEEALYTADIDNIKYILNEKDEAFNLINELCDKVRTIGSGVTDQAREYFINCIEAYRLYVKAYRYLGQGAILVRYFVNDGASANPEFCDTARAKLKECIDGLEQMYHTFNDIWNYTDHYYFLTYLVLDPERMLVVREDFERRLKGTAYYSN